MGAVLMIRDNKENFYLKDMFFGKVLTKIYKAAKVDKTKSDLASTLKTQNNKIGKIINELEKIDNDKNTDH